MKLTIFSTIEENIKPAIKRYWVSLLCSFLIASSFSFMLETDGLKKHQVDFINHLQLVAGYAAVIFIAISNTLAVNSNLQSKKVYFFGAGILATALLYYLVPTKLSRIEFPPIDLILYLLIVHLLVSVLPFMWKYRKNTDALWHYNQNLLFNFIISGIYSLVLFGGISASVFTVNALILKDMFPSHTYAHLSIFLFTFIHQLIFTIFLNRDSQNWNNSLETYTNPALKNFIKYIQIPILIIYLLILYVYLAKITLLWTLPKGMVSIMILIFGVIGIYTVLLSKPFEKSTENKLFPSLAKNYFRLLILLLPLLFTAVYVRVSEYGLTELRVALIYLDVWLACIVFYYTISKKPDILIIPVSLLVFALLCKFLPFYNHQSWSLRNQRNQIKQEFMLLGLINDKNAIQPFNSERFEIIWQKHLKEENLNSTVSAKVLDSLKTNYINVHSWRIREKLNYLLLTRNQSVIFDNIKSPVVTSENGYNYGYDQIDSFIHSLNLKTIDYNRFTSEFNESVSTIEDMSYNYSIFSAVDLSLLSGGISYPITYSNYQTEEQIMINSIKQKVGIYERSGSNKLFVVLTIGSKTIPLENKIIEILNTTLTNSDTTKEINDKTEAAVNRNAVIDIPNQMSYFISVNNKRFAFIISHLNIRISGKSKKFSVSNFNGNIQSMEGMLVELKK